MGVSRPIYVAVDSPNLGFPYFNFLGGYQLKKHPVYIHGPHLHCCEPSLHFRGVSRVESQSLNPALSCLPRGQFVHTLCQHHARHIQKHLCHLCQHHATVGSCESLSPSAACGDFASLKGKMQSQSLGESPTCRKACTQSTKAPVLSLPVSSP